jgi:DNA-binding CsgD family transcriptional regulator
MRAMERDEALERGRLAYAAGKWIDAHSALSLADADEPLAALELELLARAAYMLGQDDEYRNGLERAHHAHLDAGETARAAGCAFWIGHNLLFRGESAPGLGWFARGRRLLEREGEEQVEAGYLLIPELLQQTSRAAFADAEATATRVAEIGERFGDADLVALGVMEQGHALIRQGRTAEGLELVDETMVAVTAGELSPIVAGIVYCNTIAFCRDVFELRRAREWTAALTRWCEHQPDMVAHRGLCLVHRAEIMTLGGAWSDALEEARRVAARFTEGVLNERALGLAAYRRGEVHRLQGDFEAAEAAYREAIQLGREPQPGHALLRLTQGHRDAAAAAIRRALGESSKPLDRAALLPAFVEIVLAVGDVEEALGACEELETMAERQDSDLLRAMSSQARAAVALAEDDAAGALVAARRAWQAWHELEIPYEAARARVVVALACSGLDDRDTASFELDAARAIFARLGALPDIARIDALTGSADRAAVHGLTPRELEVLRLVASGKSNREVAAELVISERTVARHVQNIFAKLRVSSRTAASVFASEHDLL